MKICWWTNFRTANETALVDGLKRRGVDVVVCYFSEYDDYRRSIGWTPRDAGEGEFLVRSVGDARRKIGDFTERIR